MPWSEHGRKGHVRFRWRLSPFRAYSVVVDLRRLRSIEEASAALPPDEDGADPPKVLLIRFKLLGMVGISVGNPDEASRVGVFVPDKLPRAKGSLNMRRNVELAAALHAATRALLDPADEAAIFVLQSDDLSSAPLVLQKELRALPVTSTRKGQQVTLIGHGLGRKAVIEAVEGSPEQLADRVVLIQHLKNPRTAPSRYEGTQWHHVQEPPGGDSYWRPDDLSLRAVAAVIAGAATGT